MRNKIYLLLLSMFLSLLMCDSCNKKAADVEVIQNVSAEKHLQIDNRKYLFGTIHKSKTSKIVCPFKLSNRGSHRLQIYKVEASCNCLIVKEYPKVLLPNESHILNVEINIKAQRGYFNKVIFVRSNADNSLEILRIKGEILD